MSSLLLESLESRNLFSAVVFHGGGAGTSFVAAGVTAYWSADISGYENNHSVALNLSGLPAHTRVRVSLDTDMIDETQEWSEAANVTADASLVFSDEAANPSDDVDVKIRGSDWVTHGAPNVDVLFQFIQGNGETYWYIDEVIVEIGGDNDFEESSLRSNSSESLASDSSWGLDITSSASKDAMPLAHSVDVQQNKVSAVEGKFSSAVVKLLKGDSEIS